MRVRNGSKHTSWAFCTVLLVVRMDGDGGVWYRSDGFRGMDDIRGDTCASDRRLKKALRRDMTN